MEEKRYQIFVSSTYEDLKEERSKLLNTILKFKYIPAGMELFPAIDEEQMKVIKDVIDESDYYVLILGARYGSLDSEGISYTEREYDYALKQGKPIIALIHENPADILQEKTDNNEDLYKKFLIFRKKVMQGRNVAFWKDINQLNENFIFSLNATIQKIPMIGWIRGDSMQSVANIQEEFNIYRQEIERYKWWYLWMMVVFLTFLSGWWGAMVIALTPDWWGTELLEDDFFGMCKIVFPIISCPISFMYMYFFSFSFGNVSLLRGITGTLFVHIPLVVFIVLCFWKKFV